MLKVCTSDYANEDIDKLFDYIAYELDDFKAAFGYFWGIHDTIAKLSYVGEVLAYNQQPYIQKRFGMFARTILPTRR